MPYQPLCLFAEGSTTNGKAIMKFKRGAFYSMRPVIPCYIKFGDCLVKPCYDVLDFWDMMILLVSNFSMYRSQLYIMPEFAPNDYMLKKFADKVA